jgi:hypothetical protein
MPVSLHVALKVPCPLASVSLPVLLPEAKHV